MKVRGPTGSTATTEPTASEVIEALRTVDGGGVEVWLGAADGPSMRFSAGPNEVTVWYADVPGSHEDAVSLALEDAARAAVEFLRTEGRPTSVTSWAPGPRGRD